MKKLRFSDFKSLVRVHALHCHTSCELQPLDQYWKLFITYSSFWDVFPLPCLPASPVSSLGSLPRWSKAVCYTLPPERPCPSKACSTLYFTDQSIWLFLFSFMVFEAGSCQSFHSTHCCPGSLRMTHKCFLNKWMMWKLTISFSYLLLSHKPPPV